MKARTTNVFRHRLRRKFTAGAICHRLKLILTSLALNCYFLKSIVSKKRRFRVYCIGTPKSGTTSIAKNFQSSKYRALHEPLARHYLEFFKQARELGEIRRYLQKRDALLNLEVESSSFLYLQSEILVDLFSDALFILTIRDCYSWIDSMINQQYELFQHHKDSYWGFGFSELFGAYDSEMTEEEDYLKHHGLHSLKGYFSYWVEHNKHILQTIPKEKLLIIKTNQISQNLEIIADFCGAKVVNKNKSQTSFNVRKNKKISINNLDLNYLDQIARPICSELMNKFFPEIKSASSFFNFPNSKSSRSRTQ